VIIDLEVAVAAACHRLRDQRLHFLRDDADISFTASEIAETVIAEAVVEIAEKDDVMLQRKIGTPATAAATPTTSAAMETSASAASPASKAAAARRATAPSTKACLTAR